MKITRDQAKLLADLQTRIHNQLGIVLGYSHPNVLMVPDNVDYVICEADDLDDDRIQLLHREDLAVEWVDPQHYKVVAGTDPRNDHLVKEFIDKINEGVLTGTLWFDPGVTRTIDEITVRVDRRELPNQGVIFDLTMDEDKGVYSYGMICASARFDRRFKVAKQIIDEMWPQPQTPAVKVPVKDTSEEDTQKIPVLINPPRRNGFLSYLIRLLKNRI